MMTALISSVSLAGLLALAFWFYNDYRVDRLRQELFDIRDKLFDDAAAGLVRFDSPAYRVTRAMLNGMIRFGHCVSMSGVMLSLLLRRSPSATDAERVIARAFSAAPREERERCQEAMRQAHLATARHLASSPVLIALVLPAVLWAVGAITAQRLVVAMRRQLEVLDASAYNEGIAA